MRTDMTLITMILTAKNDHYSNISRAPYVYLYVQCNINYIYIFQKLFYFQLL